MKRTESVLQRSRQCWVCGKRDPLEEHHVFYGTANRMKSERYGMKVYLCPEHHRAQPEGVHGGNRELDLKLKRFAQMRFEQMFGHELFMKVFGRNWLDQEEAWQ